MKMLAIIFVSLSLVGCASQQARLTVSTSGMKVLAQSDGREPDIRERAKTARQERHRKQRLGMR